MGRDIVDAANRMVQHEIDNLIHNHRRKSEATRLKESGRCYNCEETINEGLFCDTDCREDYEKRKRHVR